MTVETQLERIVKRQSAHSRAFAGLGAAKRTLTKDALGPKANLGCNGMFAGKPPLAACAKLRRILNRCVDGRHEGGHMNGGRGVFIVGRRWFLRSTCSLPMLSLGGCQAAAPCPLCGGRLSTVGSHIDFRFLPSVNYDVWNRASD